MRTTLTALNAEEERVRGGSAGVDLRGLARDLLEGEVEAPTADVALLVRRGVDPDDFYRSELAPPWDGLTEVQRANRIDGFIELAAMLDADDAAAGVPAEMRATVRTKTLLLAFAFDETYGYLRQLGRREQPA